MKRILWLLCLTATITHADTMDHYMNIVNSIPQMEIKADPQAQAWARSARNIIALTSESIYESLALANETASQHGSPLYCLPTGTVFNSSTLNDLIQQTYRELASQQSEKEKMTVSQVALMSMVKNYPCQQQTAMRNIQTSSANQPNGLLSAMQSAQSQ